MGVGLAPVPIGTSDYNRVVEWLYAEAAMLDDGDFEGWLATLAPDISYQMPTRETVYPRDGSGFAAHFGFFSENHASLSTRVKRLQTEQAWAEQPGSRTRHFVSNVMVQKAADDTFRVRCAFMVTRIRSDLPYDMFTGERRDTLRPTKDGMKLVERFIYLDQTVLKSYNLSIFF